MNWHRHFQERYLSRNSKHDEGVDRDAPAQQGSANVSAGMQDSAHGCRVDRKRVKSDHASLTLEWASRHVKNT